MLELDEILESVNSDIAITQKWASELYDKSFGNYLKDVRDLYKRLADKSRPISDAELEDILTTLPLELIAVSESLSQFKISKEVVDITLKQKEAQFIEESPAKTITQKKEEASIAVLEYKLVKTVYATVISRVDNEINFARELIMSAKKIWDSRKNMGPPTGLVVNEGSEGSGLPDYQPGPSSSSNPSQTYIK